MNIPKFTTSLKKKKNMILWLQFNYIWSQFQITTLNLTRDNVKLQGRESGQGEERGKEEAGEREKSGERQGDILMR